MGQLNHMNRALARSRSFADTYRGTWQGERYARRVHLLKLILSGRYAELAQNQEEAARRQLLVDALNAQIDRRLGKARAHRTRAREIQDQDPGRARSLRQQADEEDRLNDVTEEIRDQILDEMKG